MMLAMMVSLAVFPQKNVTKFLGIPVDGTVSAMKQKLVAKGFKPSALGGTDCLEGVFNGGNVYVYLVENKGKIWRVAVSDKSTCNETDIRIRFNELCRQFLKNPKYLNTGTEERNLIPENTDISYDMAVHNKRFEASFVQCTQDDFNHSFMEEIREKYTQEQLQNLTPEQQEEINNMASIRSSEVIENKSVWFTIIDRFPGQYVITIFYDNGYNKADGEDL